MSGFNKSPLAFDDIRELLDKALDRLPKALRVPCQDHSHAMSRRTRFNYFRAMDRDQNARTYPEGHPMHKKTPYDRLIFRIPRKGAPDDNYIYIEPRISIPFEEVPEQPK